MTDWPQEIRKPHVYCNFRPSKKERSKKRERAADRRPGMSSKHLVLIRQMPCCVSLVMPAGDPHHLKQGPAKDERGMGQKATDRWTVPLTRIEHDALERIGSRHEHAWFRERGIADPYELANALWHATGDLSRMIAILMAHRGK